MTRPILIVGPIASGKSAQAIGLALALWQGFRPAALPRREAP